jgi:hypothetical protein
MTSVSCAPDSIAQVAKVRRKAVRMDVRDAHPPEPDPERVLVGERIPFPGQEERVRVITPETSHVLE